MSSINFEERAEGYLSQMAGGNSGGGSSAGGGVLKVTFTLGVDESENTIITASSKTVREINAAFSAGQMVIGSLDYNEGIEHLIYLSAAGLGEAGGRAEFTSLMYADIGVLIDVTGSLSINDNTDTETWTLTMIPLASYEESGD